MADKTHTTLVHVLETVLEQFAFAFCELTPKEELETEETDFVHSSLSFDGPCSGELSITMPAELCAEIAGNILGMDSSDDDITDYAQDSLKELLNVYVGNVLTGLYGEDALFIFGTPEIMRFDESGWQEKIEDPNTIGVLVEDTPALLRFMVNEK
jgi:hypothetical protein